MIVAVPARQAEIAAFAEPVGDLIADALAEIGFTTQQVADLRAGDVI